MPIWYGQSEYRFFFFFLLQSRFLSASLLEFYISQIFFLCLEISLLTRCLRRYFTWDATCMRRVDSMERKKQISHSYRTFNQVQLRTTSAFHWFSWNQKISSVQYFSIKLINLCTVLINWKLSYIGYEKILIND